MKNDDDDFELSEEDWDIINSVTQPEQMSIEEALQSKDPLGNINNNLSGKSKSQKAYRLLYAAILEVNTAGVAILFDRFTDREIGTIYKKYRELNAHRLCNAIDDLKNIIKKELGAKSSKNKISNFFNSTPIREVKAIYKKNNDIVDEMEKQLTEFAGNNINELKD